MKVAFIYLGRKGGGPVYSLEIAKKLSRRVELLCVISNQIDNLDFWEKAGFNLYKINTYRNFFEFFVSLLNIKKFFHLYKKVKDFKPEVIYCPFFFFWLPIINFLFPKTPKIFTVHDPILHSGEKNLLMEIIQKKTIKKTKRVIILSEVFKEIIHSQGVSLENIDIIPLGVFNYYLENFKIKKISHSPTLLFFGRVLKYKGLENLLKAFFLIKKEIPESRLLIVGKGNIKPYRKLLHQQRDIVIENRWIEDEEVGEYFAQSDILVCPYQEASQSGAIPVAYAFKIPVIATRVGGLVEQVEDGVAGFLVSPNNPQEIAEKCIFLLRNEEKRREMGENGFKKAKKEWNWEKITQKILESLKKAIKFDT